MINIMYYELGYMTSNSNLRITSVREHQTSGTQNSPSGRNIAIHTEVMPKSSEVALVDSAI